MALDYHCLTCFCGPFHLHSCCEIHGIVCESKHYCHIMRLGNGDSLENLDRLIVFKTQGPSLFLKKVPKKRPGLVDQFGNMPSVLGEPELIASTTHIVYLKSQ